MKNFHLVLVLSLLLGSTSVVHASDDSRWKDEAMSALLANAEVVLEAKNLVKSGRPDFVGISHAVICDKTNPEDGVRSLVETFTFEVVGNFGDALESIATLKITQTSTFYGRGYTRTFETSLVPYLN